LIRSDTRSFTARATITDPLVFIGNPSQILAELQVFSKKLKFFSAFA